MLLADLATTSTAVAGTRSRKEKIRLIATTLQGADPAERSLAARFLAGQVRQERLDVGWAAMSGDVPDPAPSPTLELADVDAAFAALASSRGEGSRQARRDILARLFGRATAAEQGLLRGLILGELRQGALEGVVVQGIAAASEQPVQLVQRALMRSGDLGHIGAVAMAAGEAGLREIQLKVFRPVQPMLAATAASVTDALAEFGRMAVDYKLDGARIQVHRRGDEVRTYTRNLREVARPDVAAVVRRLPVAEIVLDGEVIGVGDDGRPRPFQQTMSTFGSDDLPVGDDATDLHLTPYFFDCLRLDGRDLLDEALSVRHEALTGVLGEAHLVPRVVVDDPRQASTFFAQALSEGHEGVVCKSLDAAYAAGRRGSGWRKVKPVHTLDLVVLAAEWGSGRRRGWLSNLHLGARDPHGEVGTPGAFVMLGKTFKGLTDEMLTWQTKQFEQLAVTREDHIVTVQPKLVVEVAFDGVLASTRYPGGVSLRFARVKRYRTDKDPSEADTITTVRAIHHGRVPPA